MRIKRYLYSSKKGIEMFLKKSNHVEMDFIFEKLENFREFSFFEQFEIILRD